MGVSEAAPTPDRGSDVEPEKTPVGSDANANTNGADVPATAAEAVRNIKSPGVARVEALASVITFTDRVIIMLSLFLVAFAYGLDGFLRTPYQTAAASSMKDHSLTATVNIIRAVIGAAAQPTAAKIADVFGRIELIVVSAFFYVLGTIVESVSHDITTLAVGTAIYQIGYTIMLLLVEIIVADITSTRARLFFSYVPALPSIINTWISGDVAQAVLDNCGWRWGYGMWCIIYPVCTLPLVGSLLNVSMRAKRQGLLKDYKSSFEILGYRNFFLELFWLLDVIGIILLIAMFDLILVPMTIAGGVTTQWATAKIIAPIVIGFLCIPAFIFWELRAPHPLIPFRLMKDRGVWAPIFIAIFLQFAWYIQGDYLYTVLVVAFNFDIQTATRITGIYAFCSTLVGIVLGFVVYKIRRLKWLIVTGTGLFMIAFGLLIRFRGSTEGESGKVGVIAAQVVLGIAGGMFPYPTQASLQVGLQHEHIAVMTGVYLATYNIGGAFGNTVSGAIWTQTLPKYLEQKVKPEVAAEAYASPLTAIITYPWGTPERDGIVAAYRQATRLLGITGVCLCVPLIGFALFLRDPKLNDKQTLAKETDSLASTEDGEHEETA